MPDSSYTGGLYNGGYGTTTIKSGLDSTTNNNSATRSSEAEAQAREATEARAAKEAADAKAKADAEAKAKADTKSGLSAALSAAQNPKPVEAPPAPTFSDPLGQPNPFSRDPRKSYGGPIGGPQGLTRDARFAVADQANFRPAQVQRAPGDAEAMARMAQAESGAINQIDGDKNLQALQGTMDVMRNRAISPKFNQPTIHDVIGAKKQFSPMQDGSYAKTKVSPTDIKMAEGVLSGETPSVVGNALNYANTDYLKTPKGIAESSAATRKAFAEMPVEAAFHDAKKKGVMHSFGTIGESDVAFNDTKKPSSQQSYQVAGDTVTKTDKNPTLSKTVGEEATKLSQVIDSFRQSLTQPAGTLTAPYAPIADPVAQGPSTRSPLSIKAPTPDPRAQGPGTRSPLNLKDPAADPVAQGPATRSPLNLRAPVADPVAQGPATRSPLNLKPPGGLLDDVRKRGDIAFAKWKAEQAAKAPKAQAAGTLTGPYDAPEDLTRAAYDASLIGTEDLTGAAQRQSLQAPAGGPSTRGPLNLKAPPSSDPRAQGPSTRSPLSLKAPPSAPAYDPTTGYGASAPDLKRYTQSPEDLKRQAAQVAAFKESIKKGVNPALASTLSPVVDTMKYYDKNKFAINLANSFGALEKPVTKVAGAAITKMQDFIRDLGKSRPKDVSPAKPGNLIADNEYGKPPTKATTTQVAETMVKAPEEAIAASPELQKLAVVAPNFLQRVFLDATTEKDTSNKFKTYIVSLATSPETATGTLTGNDYVKSLFASLASGQTSSTGGGKNTPLPPPPTSGTTNASITAMFSQLASGKTTSKSKSPSSRRSTSVGSSPVSFT